MPLTRVAIVAAITNRPRPIVGTSFKPHVGEELPILARGGQRVPPLQLSIYPFPFREGAGVRAVPRSLPIAPA